MSLLAACCNKVRNTIIAYTASSPVRWNIIYFIVLTCCICIWSFIYIALEDASNYLVSLFFKTSTHTHLANSIEFFLYDTVKILLLLLLLIYAIAWIRASMNVEKVREYLSNKGKSLSYFLGALFGAITPFCSCSSIPLFLGFTTAGIPIGASLAFLITSPLINEIAVILLWSLLGWKFTLLYITVGMLAGILGGFFMDKIQAERWLQPYILESIAQVSSQRATLQTSMKKTFSVKQRHYFAYTEMKTICKRVWKWVILGVGVGALLHGFVPENWFADNFGANEWWTVPAAVFVSIPLYSNVTGIIPIMESLLLKGLPLGTTLAFCMGSVVASIPEFMMLRQIMTAKLQVAFVVYLWLILTCIGYFFNAFEPFIR